ncbi:MAG: bifunctional UDP-N-acetylglucosamine diphosphorylase/glucosamine-1-phosphate N-acetyltransferase GlmU [Myxococcales bacterium]|nr:bifunctional UDP-N-acetylglucosamine diphosphorylase/glucosamine-1-phosphate N-acetyltransferase GlmU [Myxococcales bacterium]
MARARAAVVMAAGQGTRMRSALAKVLHPVAGRPMIHYAVREALALGCAPVVVIVGHQREAVEARLAADFPGAPVVTAVQAEQRGTAHAVACAGPALAGFAGDVFILSGDVPGLPAATLAELDAAGGDAAVAVLGMKLADPAAYGRLVRGPGGELLSIVEYKDSTPAQQAIDEVNAGVYRVHADFLFDALGRVGSDNAQGEFYLTDIIGLSVEAGRGARTLVLGGDRALEAAGVNDRADLAAAEGRMQARLRARLLAAGVTMIDPARVVLGDGVEVGPDSVLEPDVTLLGSTRVGRDCVIEQGCRLVDTAVADGVHFKAYTVTEGASVGPDCTVGPFARLREGTVLHAHVKVGNFVETKKAELFDGAKASHLTYLGDATVGAGANVGAGTITCNYDGKKKHRTSIGAGAFIGSDTQLVAPVAVGDGAYVAAGSTVTEDVPAGSLALSRVRQQNIEGWVARKQARDAGQE